MLEQSKCIWFCEIYYSCPLLSFLRNQLQIRKGKPIDKFPIYLSGNVFQPSTKTLQKEYQKITFRLIWKCFPSINNNHLEMLPAKHIQTHEPGI